MMQGARDKRSRNKNKGKGGELLPQVSGVCSKIANYA